MLNKRATTVSYPVGNAYGCVSFLAARIPAAAVSFSHMYAPRFVFP
jgi:hypothetical protein